MTYKLAPAEADEDFYFVIVIGKSNPSAGINISSVLVNRIGFCYRYNNR